MSSSLLWGVLWFWVAASWAERESLNTFLPTPTAAYSQLITTGAGERNTLLCRDSGNVGIGVKSPAHKLSVAGSGGFSGVLSAARLQSRGPFKAGGLANDPPGKNGMIYYNNQTHKFRVFRQGQWKNLSP